MNTDRIFKIEAMLKEEPGDSFLKHALAIEYMAIGNVLKAIELLVDNLSVNPDYLAAYYQLGKCYEGINKIDNAVNTYKEGIQKAEEQHNIKTANELKEALWMLEDE